MIVYNSRRMDRARGQKLQKLFVAACAAQGDAREELLQSHARRDPELVEQVRSLLTADAQPGITDSLGRQLASVHTPSTIRFQVESVRIA